MASGLPMMLVYEHFDHPHHHNSISPDPDVLDYVGHDHIDHFHPRGSAPSPPPPYEPISYPLPSPLPSPAFPPATSVTAGSLISERARPVPHNLLDDPAFSPDPRYNPHFIMTSNEQIRAAPPPPPHDRPNPQQIPPSFQPGLGVSARPPTQHVRSQSAPYPPQMPPAQDFVPPPPSQSRPPPPRTYPPTISASSLFPIHPMWHPPVFSTASSTTSGSSFSSRSSLPPHTPGASPASSASSGLPSPRESPRSSVSPTPSPSSIYSTRDKPIPPIPTGPTVTEAPPVTEPVRITAPPRSSSLAHPPRTSSRTPAATPSTTTVPLPTTARPAVPPHSESAPELRTRPPPPQPLSRSATAPTHPPQEPTHQSAAPNRSQSQSHPTEQQRGRSREQQPPQGVQRNRSRRPSVSAPRDLDRIDELDETDPRGLAWHHGGPYEATRSISQRRRDAQGLPADQSNVGGQMHRSQSRDRERQAPRRKPSMSAFSVEPGQIFPSGALFQAMQGAHLPPQPQAQAYPPPFDPYSLAMSQDSGPRLPPQMVYTPGAPPLPPPSSQPSEHEARRERRARRSHHHSRHASHEHPSPSHEEQLAQSSQPFPSQQPQVFLPQQPLQAPPQQPQPFASQMQMQGQPNQMPTPAPPTIPMPPPSSANVPVRPPLQQRPSQRSQVRFESPSRPDIRPPLKQGSVDGDAYDGNAPSQPPVSVQAQVLMPEQRPPPSSTQPQARHDAPAPIQKSQSRPTSMYPTANSSTSNLQNEPLPRPDIPLPPRRPTTSIQSQTPMPPRHIPKRLVMPTPLQPMEDQRRAEAARQASQQQPQVQAPPMGLSTRSDDGHGTRPDVHTHGGRHMLHHHSVSYSRQQASNAPQAVQAPGSMNTRQTSQSRAQAIPMSAGPNVLRKRVSSNHGSAPMGAPEIPASSASAAMFAARIVEPVSGPAGQGKPKAVERVATAVWPRDRVKEEQLAKEQFKEKKMGRKLSKLSRKLTK